MANSHDLKTLPVYFDAVLRGDKTFEVRKNDRDFQTGDTLVLKEWDPTIPTVTYQPHHPSPGAYTGREIMATASYVLHDTWGQFGIERGYVVIGFRRAQYRDVPGMAPEDISVRK